ncbi:MAG: hypothetical protein MHPSP_002481 [Paramarteilia canceri]
MLRIGFASHDREFHFKILKTLTSRNFNSLIIKLNPHHLSDYINSLVSSVNEDCNLSKFELDLICTYYESNKMFFNCAQFMLMVPSGGNKETFAEKVQRLHKVALILKCIPFESLDSQVENLILRVNQSIEAAHVQSLSMNRVSSKKNAEYAKAYDEMNLNLFSLNELLLQVAHPLDLFELKLRILYASNSTPSLEVVRILWQNLINQQINEHLTVGASLNILRDTLKFFLDKKDVLFLPLDVIVAGILNSELEVEEFLLPFFTAYHSNTSLTDLIVALKKVIHSQQTDNIDKVLNFLSSLKHVISCSDNNIQLKVGDLLSVLKKIWPVFITDPRYQSIIETIVATC